MPNLSVTMIVRGTPEPVLCALQSLRDHDLLRDEDELVLVHTYGKEGRQGLPEAVHAVYPSAKIIDRSDLVVDMAKGLEILPRGTQTRAREETRVLDGTLRSFAEAREAARQAGSNKWHLWIDSDDLIEEDEPGQFRRFLDERLDQDEKIATIFLDYHYQRSADGKTTVFLRRERVYRKDWFYWKGACHETAIPIPGETAERAVEGVTYVQDLPVRVVHQKPSESSFPSDVRNYLILRREILEQEERHPPLADIRLYYYYANACMGLLERDEALRCYKIVREHSGSMADVLQALLNSAKMFLLPSMEQRPVFAKQYAWEAVHVAPDDPRGWYMLQAADFHLHEYQQSLFWFAVAQQLGEPKVAAHAVNPEELKTTPYILAAQAIVETEGDTQDLLRCAQHLHEHRRDSQEIQEIVSEFYNWMSGKQLAEAAEVVAINKAGPTADIFTMRRRFSDVCERFQSVPPQLEDKSLGVLEPTFKVERPRVDFFCGRSAEDWGPVSAQDGHAGSERAVWEMAKRLSDRGVRVGVYASPPRAERVTTWDGPGKGGVEWRHHAEFDYEIERDVVVLWRMVGMLERPIVARKKFLWCHDIQRESSWRNARDLLYDLDGAFLLSQYHVETLPKWVRESYPEKIFRSRNGIDQALLSRSLEETRKVPERIIYTSSPDRGAVTAMRAFNEVRRRHPQAELHVFYGFQGAWWMNVSKHWALSIPDVGRDIWSADYMRLFYEEVDRGEGKIHVHGRVNWSEMAYWYATAGVWLYPTTFGEISCISAMEALAANCIVCATDTAALRETIDFESDPEGKVLIPRSDEGRPVRVGECLERALSLSRAGAPDRRAYREAQDWDGVAEQWLHVMGIKEPCLNS